MEIDKEFAEKAIGFFELVQSRPYMFKHQGYPAENWLMGFDVDMMETQPQHRSLRSQRAA